MTYAELTREDCAFVDTILGALPDDVIRAHLDRRQAKNQAIIIDAVLEQIKADVERADMTAIEELIWNLPSDVLMNFLPKT